MKTFKTFNLAVQFYHSISNLKLKGDAKDQLHRAARSVALNLAEGRGRRTSKDQQKFFNIAFASMRECQAVFTLERLEHTNEYKELDKLAAHLYKLLANLR